MENKPEKQKKIAIALGIIFLLITVIGVTYSFISLTVQGTKRQVIKAGTLSLELYEDNAIRVAGALPMYDEVGMIQKDVFTFRLVNNSALSASYVIKLVEVGNGTLSKSDVKYGLVRDGETTIGFLSDLEDGVIDSGTIAGNKTTINYALRFWIRNDLEDETLISGKSLTYKIDIEVGMEEVEVPSDDTTVTFAETIAKLAQTPTETMFNYTNEGCIMNMETQEQSCPAEATNGIYSMLDDDGTSYFYRGEVDNLVQFGEYEQDYYVYRYYDYDFVSLEACQYYSSSCSESNKTLKYAASDNVPMYWRIIRINGDGSIRMIYVGTSKDALAQDTGIGLSRYNEEYDDSKYTGYSYDRTTSETKSDAKAEIDMWYSTYLANTEYDSYIAEGKFCSDSSGYEYDSVATEMFGADVYTFNAFRRNFANMFGRGNVNPTFKCSETTETFGGSYTLKAGLITLDEIIAAGGQNATNNSYYLYNGTKGNEDGWYFWSMSPAKFGNGNAFVGLVSDIGDALNYSVNNFDDLLRPVINLKAGTSFQSGTDGSTTTPYEVVMD